MSAAPPEEIPPEAAPGRREWALALAVALLTALLHAALATRRGYWYDEYLTIHAAKLDLAALCRNRLDMGHSPLYFIYARLGLLLGEGPHALRSTSALASGALVLGLTGMAGALGLRAILPGLWLAALLEPYWISIGTQVRYMMPMLAVASFVTWAAIAYAARPDGRRGMALALATALLLWIHASTQFFVAALAAFLAWDALANAEGRPAARRLLRLWPVALGLLLSTPLLFLIRKHGDYLTPNFPELRELRANLLEVTLGYDQLWPDFFDLPSRPYCYLLAAAALLTLGLAGWDLHRQGRRRALRLLAALAVGLPLTFVAFCRLARDFSGPARYLTLFGIPWALAVAVVLKAAVPRRPWRWIFQGLLVGLLAFQAVGAALERGDHHREACRWLASNARRGETILMTPSKANLMGLDFYTGFKDAGRCIAIYGEKNPVKLREFFHQAFARTPRVFYIIYFSRPKSIIGETIKRLKKEKLIVADRHWKLSPRTIVGAIVSDPAEVDWLKGLPPPELEWGPARGKTGG